MSTAGSMGVVTALNRPLVAADGLLDRPLGEIPAIPASEVSRAGGAVAVLRHAAAYAYPSGASRVVQRLVVVPRRAHGDQQRVAWRFRVLVDGAPSDASVRTEVDRFGNTVITTEVEVANATVTYQTRAVVTRGVDGPGVAAWPPSDTDGAGPLTTPGEELRAAADDVPHAPPLDLAAALMDVAAGHVAYGKGITTVHTSAEEAWQLRSGVCQDLAHVLIAMCRHRGIAARYVSGHLIGEGASHAWVEVCDRASGRVLALDPTHDRATDLRYLTVAVGRDYGDVAPTRGTAWSGGGPGQLDIDKTFRIVAVA